MFISAGNGSPASDSVSVIDVVVAIDITYTITVTNNGDADATDVVVTDALPSGVTVIANPDGATVAAGTLTWDLGTVAANGGSVTVSVTVRTQTP